MLKRAHEPTRQNCGSAQSGSPVDTYNYEATMVILHVLAPAETGGLERVVQTLALGLAEHRHEVHVAAVLGKTNGARHPFLAPLTDSAVQLHEIAVGNRAYLREWAVIVELCRRIRPAVVHTHGYRPDIVAASAARRLGIPTATTVHGFTGGNMRNRLYEALQRRAFRSFDVVVPVSRGLVDSLTTAGVPPARLRFIQNAWPGSSTMLSRQEARRQLGLSDDRFQVGWVGRLSHEKGPDVLLAALPNLGAAPIDVNFLGDGPDRAELEALARRHQHGDRVRWLGNRPSADRLFRAFDVFVLSSRTEGTPMVLFEAMAAGVPIVAARVGGVPDVVDDSCACLVPPEDPIALAAAIRSVQQDPATAAARAACARQRVTTQFSPDAWVRRYEALYHELRS